MKPAVCSVCGKSALNDSPDRCGDWVEFKNYAEQDSVSLSHPAGLEFFCSEHLSAALDFSSIDSDEALDKLKLIFPCKDFNIDNGIPEVSWWKRLLNK